MAKQQLETQDIQIINNAITAALHHERGGYVDQYPGFGGKYQEGKLEQFYDQVHEQLREQFRGQMLDAVHNHLMELVKDRVRGLLQQRLAQEIRAALIQGQGVQGAFNIENVILRLTERFGLLAHDRYVDFIRERMPETTNERLQMTIREVLGGGSMAQFLDYDETDNVAFKIRQGIEFELHERVVHFAREKLGQSIRERVKDACRERFHDALNQALTQAKTKGGDLDFIVMIVQERMTGTFEQRLGDGMKDRVRDVLREGLEEVGGDRLRQAIQSALGQRAAEVQFDGHTPRAGGYGEQQFGQTGFKMDKLRERIINKVRDNVSKMVTQKMESFVKQRIEETLRDVLDGALQSIFAEQMMVGGKFNQDHLVQALRYRLTETLHNEVTSLIYERVGIAVRQSFGQSLQQAVTQK